MKRHQRFSHQRRSTTSSQLTLRIFQTTWTQTTQHSHSQLDLELEELLSTLKSKKHHAKKEETAQEWIFHQFQDQTVVELQAVKLERLYRMLQLKEEMPLQTEEIFFNQKVHNLWLKMIVNSTIKESEWLVIIHGFTNSHTNLCHQPMVTEAQMVQNMDGIHQTHIQMNQPMVLSDLIQLIHHQEVQ